MSLLSHTRPLVQDPEAFTVLYGRHAEKVLVYFVRRTFDPEVARDLMAETFACAFEKRRSFRGTKPQAGCSGSHVTC